MGGNVWADIESWPVWLRWLAAGITVATVIIIVTHDWPKDE